MNWLDKASSERRGFTEGSRAALLLGAPFSSMLSLNLFFQISQNLDAQ